MAQSVEQRFRKPQVKGSSPFVGFLCRGVAQFGSAFGSGPKGRRFKSCHLDQKRKPDVVRCPVFFSTLHKIADKSDATGHATLKVDLCTTLSGFFDRTGQRATLAEINGHQRKEADKKYSGHFLPCVV